VNATEDDLHAALSIPCRDVVGAPGGLAVHADADQIDVLDVAIEIEWRDDIVRVDDLDIRRRLRREQPKPRRGSNAESSLAGAMSSICMGTYLTLTSPVAASRPMFLPICRHSIAVFQALRRASRPFQDINAG
jgi:hypothetical protein